MRAGGRRPLLDDGEGRAGEQACARLVALHDSCGRLGRCFSAGCPRAEQPPWALRALRPPCWVQVKNVERIELGRYTMETWYFSPFPPEFRECKVRPRLLLAAAGRLRAPAPAAGAVRAVKEGRSRGPACSSVLWQPHGLHHTASGLPALQAPTPS